MTTRQITIAVILTLCLVGFVFTISWIKFLNTPLITEEQGYKYRVQPGNSFKTVINDLYFKNIIKNRLFLRILVRMRGEAQELKAGEYLFPKGTTPTTMIHQLVTGTGLVYHAFTIVPGWNFKELRESLQNENFLRHTLQNMSDESVMGRMGHPDLTPEGQFFPDTYYFAEGITDVVLLKRAFQAMQNKLNTAWQERESDLPYKNPNEVLIAASLIEKEAYLKDERPVIAGVLVNRLRKDMLLQIDPTVIYGMGTRYDGKIHKENLTENTPYNTYVHKGLPPAPIAIPSLDSIMAVVHPQHNDYLYYVARGDGSHEFSVTYEEHQTAVTKFNANTNSWFFNKYLIRYHLLKLFSKQIYTLNPSH